MAIIGIAVYGSRARGEANPRADLDLLAVVSDCPPAAALGPNHTLSCYTLRDLVCRAGIGDLFLLHVVTEARVVYELWPVFDRIRRSFRYKDDYGREIHLASEAGWFLARHAERFVDRKRFNERMAWCTRTILIARAANDRRAIFSADDLARFAGSQDVAAIIRNKECSRYDAGIAARFREFLGTFGGPEPPPLSVGAQKARFDADRNLVGSRAAAALIEGR